MGGSSTSSYLLRESNRYNIHTCGDSGERSVTCISFHGAVCAGLATRGQAGLRPTHKTVCRAAHLQLRQLWQQLQLLQVRNVAVMQEQAQGAQLLEPFGRQASTPGS